MPYCTADVALAPWPAQCFPVPQGGAQQTAAAGRGTFMLELATKPYKQKVEEFIHNTPVCRGDFDHKILLIFDALHEQGRVDAGLKHLYDVVQKLPRAKVHHWRGYLHKLLRDFDDEAYHSVKGQLAAKHAERLPWLHEPCDHQHLRPVAAEFVPGHLGWKGEMQPQDFAACARHKLHAEAPEFHPGEKTYDPTASEHQELHADAAEFHPGDKTYDPTASQEMHAEAPEFHPGDSSWGMKAEEAKQLKCEKDDSAAGAEPEGSAKGKAKQKDLEEKSTKKQEMPQPQKAPLQEERAPECVEAKA